MAEKKDLKAAHKADADAEARRIAERDKPVLDIIRTVYDRVGTARAAAAVSIAELYKAQGKHFSDSIDVEKQLSLEDGTAKLNTNTTLPFGYSFYASDAKALCKVADLLNCSIDYLLGRTTEPRMGEVIAQATSAASESGTIWQSGDPADPGDYILMLQPYKGSLQFELWRWEDEGWEDDIGEYNQDIDGEILGWIPMPKKKQKSACNDACITGMSTSGHCGAAAFCNTEYSCCLQCPDPCNARCGWVAEQSEVIADE